MQLLFLVVSSCLFLLAAPIAAVETGKVSPQPLICAPPVSTCTTTDASGLGECPDGHVCRCVPSCPTCRDCVAKVCVAGGEAMCRTACDCPPGLGCFDGRCIAGFAPVFCCDEGPCPAGDQCQHRDGRMDNCEPLCVDQAWRCAVPGGIDNGCGDDRECRCAASCPLCEDCGASVCVPAGAPPPYRCAADGSCANSGDRCICVSSCPDCDDCAMNICVPGCGSKCEDRQRRVAERIRALVDRSQTCSDDADCAAVSTATQCHRTCSDMQFVNRRFQAKVQRIVERLDHSVCSRYRADGCPPVTAHCPHKPFTASRPACVEGRCAGVGVHKPSKPSQGSAAAVKQP